jgi:hypothetical protein
VALGRLSLRTSVPVPILIALTAPPSKAGAILVGQVDSSLIPPKEIIIIII